MHFKSLMTVLAIAMIGYSPLAVADSKLFEVSDDVFITSFDSYLAVNKAPTRISKSKDSKKEDACAGLNGQSVLPLNTPKKVEQSCTAGDIIVCSCDTSGGGFSITHYTNCEEDGDNGSNLTCTCNEKGTGYSCS